jgi:hypothetical protein
MSVKICEIEYYYITIEDQPGEGVRILNKLKNASVNLRAATVFPVSGGKTQMDLFPENADSLIKAFGDAETALVGPKRAFLIQGPDRAGAIVELHQRLADAGVNAYAANGISDAHGGFGYILWVRPEEYEKAAKALDV